jgi:hypothetical protein
MDFGGNFVVAWTAKADQFGEYAQTDVLVKRFNADGACTGASVVAGDSSQNEHDPSIAVDADGDFFLSYTKDLNSGPVVMGVMQSYVKKTFPVTTVVANKGAREDQSSTSCSPSGVFAVAYAENDTTIRLARYSWAAGFLDDQLIDRVINLGTDTHVYRVMAPNVSTDNAGNSVVVWQHEFAGPHNSAPQFDVMARRVPWDGTAGPTFNLTKGTAASEQNPVVALDPNKGSYVVAYESGGAICVTEVAATETVLGILGSYTIGGNDHFQRQQPAVAIGVNYQYTVTYTATQDYGVENIFGPLDPGGGIFGKRGFLV